LDIVKELYFRSKMREGRQRFDIYKEWEGKKLRIQGIGDDLAASCGEIPFHRRLDKMSVLEALETSSTMRIDVFHKTYFNVFLLTFHGAFGAPPEFSLFIFIKRIRAFM
jgi:hypothetical protein